MDEYVKMPRSHWQTIIDALYSKVWGQEKTSIINKGGLTSGDAANILTNLYTVCSEDENLDGYEDGTILLVVAKDSNSN